MCKKKLARHCTLCSVFGMKSQLASRAQKMVYLLHNSGRNVPVALMQMLADVAKRNGSTAPMVLNYADGNTNGR